jgi:homoserine dehydrogenase
LVTHETNEAAIEKAIARVAKLEAVLEPPALIRIEPS